MCPAGQRRPTGCRYLHSSFPCLVLDPPELIFGGLMLAPALTAPVAAPDMVAAEAAARGFLAALGVPLDTEETGRTAARMAAAYTELLTPQPFEPTDFDNPAGYGELVLARGVPFRSVCAHHLM